MRKLADEVYPGDEIVPVMDDLNIRSLASFCEAFWPAKAWRMTERLEIHSTPKHGSRRNLAETELSVPNRQCLSRQTIGFDYKHLPCCPNRHRLSAS